MSGPGLSHVVERTEVLVPGPAEALAGLLGCDPPDPVGGPLPLLWHTVYLLDRPRLADLGPDGHPRLGVVPVPPAEGMRRMFAGGRVRLLSPLRLGRTASRRSAVASSTVKQGRTGPLTLAEAARRLANPEREGGAVLQLAYRLEAPLFDGDGMIVSAVRAGPEAVQDEAQGAVRCAVRDRSGRRTASATWTGPA